MKEEIKVPAVGESITTGILSAWHKQNGEQVEAGENLYELETDKAAIDVPAPESGVLEILVQEGTEVSIGQTVGRLDRGEGASGGAAKTGAEGLVKSAGASETAESAPASLTEKAPKSSAEQGPGASAELPAKSQSEEQAGVRAEGQAQVASGAADGGPGAGETEGPGEARSERVAMSTIRRRTAERLVQARQSAAYVTTFNEIDMQEVINIRTQYQGQFEKEHGIKIGFMSFFVKAACQALKEFPVVNTEIDGQDIVYHHYYDIGVAVSIDQGLVVPVIRRADSGHFVDIERAIASLVQRAREKKLTPDDLAGGTFTITNGGVFGSMFSTPIPAYPQTAILGMHAIKKRPAVIEDEVVVRPIMIVALTYDHRVIDGREAVRFLGRVKEFIEEPEKLLLEL